MDAVSDHGCSMSSLTQHSSPPFATPIHTPSVPLHLCLIYFLPTSPPCHTPLTSIEMLVYHKPLHMRGGHPQKEFKFQLWLNIWGRFHLESVHYWWEGSSMTQGLCTSLARRKTRVWLHCINREIDLKKNIYIILCYTIIFSSLFFWGGGGEGFMKQNGLTKHQYPPPSPNNINWLHISIPSISLTFLSIKLAPDNCKYYPHIHR